MAIDNGIDLVIELPCIYSISSAENFANGAIKILNSLKIVDHISFGAECEEISKLNNIANVLYEEPKEFKSILSSELAKGYSFPKARENSVIKYLKDKTYSDIISMPNNILGIEYLKALKKLRSKIQPVLVTRKDSGHLNTDYTGTISSASAIRNMIKTGHTRNLKNALTPSSYTILKDEINQGHFVKDFSDFEKIIMYNLRLKNIEDIQKLPDVSEGLENLIKKAASSYNTLEDFINTVSSKRYPETRIKRIILYSLLNITSKEMEISKKVTPYVRILGFNENGKKLLSMINKKNPNLNIITSLKKFMDENNNKNLQMMIKKDILATDVYTLGFFKDSLSNLDYSKKVISK